MPDCMFPIMSIKTAAKYSPQVLQSILHRFDYFLFQALKSVHAFHIVRNSGRLARCSRSERRAGFSPKTHKNT